MDKILVIGTGGTIACVRDGSVRLDNPFKICDCVNDLKVEFVCKSPFSVLSENISIGQIFKLISFVEENLKDFDKIIILHGSDTLAFTASFIGNYFYNKAIVLVASNKPIGEEGSNGVSNFIRAVDYLIKGNKGVVVSYDRIFDATKIVSADDEDRFIEIKGDTKPIKNPILNEKNILVIRPYVGIDYSSYNLDNVDGVIHTMYHSATAPSNVISFIEECKKKNIPFYFVTSKPVADYESAKDFDNIIFNSTLENAYAKIMLTSDDFSDILC